MTIIQTSQPFSYYSNYLVWMYNVRKYLLIHAIVISFVFFITPTILAASDVERKIEELKQAIRINPDDADAHANLGLAYFSLGVYEEAIEEFKQAIRINPDYINAHYNLGFAYNLSNDKDSALEQYEILKSLDPEIADILFRLINK